MKVAITLNEHSEAGRYLLACARIRGISPTSLVHRLIATISEDQLVPSVLDDDANIRIHNKGEHSYRGPAAV